MGRILSDAYGKDIVRSQQERTNLNANAKDIDVTAAETIRTSQREPFPGNELLDYIENRASSGKREKYVRGEIDRRDPLCKQWVQRDAARMYALRPRDTDVWYLSPYEFWMYWEIAPARYVATAGMLEEEEADPQKFHCRLTNPGMMKVAARELSQAVPEGGHPKLVPGEDYRVKEDSKDPWWVAYPETDATAQFRHTWILQRRQRPRDPTFHGCALPYQSDRDADRTAKIIMTYFRPWTFYDEGADDHVIAVARMCGDAWEWQPELQTWFQGQVLTLQIERCIRNFLSVVQARPEGSGPGDDVHDDDVYDDIEMTVEHESLPELLLTTKRRDVDPDAEGAPDDANYAIQAAAMDIGRRVWNTYHKDIKLSPTEGARSKKSEEEIEQVIKEAQKKERSNDQGDKGTTGPREEACS